MGAAPGFAGGSALMAAEKHMNTRILLLFFKAVVLTLLIVGGAPGRSWAQGVGSVRGELRRSSDNGPVAGAVVRLLPSTRVDTTDSAGRFSFREVTPGRYRVTVLRLGFVPFADSISVAGGDSASILLRIPEIPVTLPGVRVSEPLPARRFEGAYRRAATARGSFFTKEQIQKINPLDLQTLLNGIPGVRISDRYLSFTRCQDATSWNKIQLWIDGYRVSGRTDKNATAETHELLRAVSPSAIEIMEVYTGVSSIPGEFLDDACGAIVIWTKAH